MDCKETVENIGTSECTSLRKINGEGEEHKQKQSHKSTIKFNNNKNTTKK